jgi:DNA-binding response OmpR family regulator
LKPASILVTDDESNIRLMLKTTLQAEGYVVNEAANGRDALEAIERDHPDLMLLDLNMPVLDGMAVLETLKMQTDQFKPRVIVLTAYGSIPAAVKATHLEADDFLEKPITPADLRQVVQTILNEPRPQTTPPEHPTTEPAANYEQVLMRIRKAMRTDDFANAETLLSQAAARQQNHSAQYFNLLGILYEVQQKWRLARKCYTRAIREDANFEPARINLQRLYELTTFGRTTQVVARGDETHGQILTELAKAQINARATEHHL